MILALLFLFIIQLVGFYFIVLLYMKFNKLKELESKQRKLMDEMDDSLGAYLSELKDENDRLIEAFANQKEKNQEIHSEITHDTPPAVDKEQKEAKPEFPIPKAPVHLALKSYKSTLPNANKENEEELVTEEKEPVPLVENEVKDDRSRILYFHEQGYSIEAIAKKLNKGKTEVELLLKFK